MGVEYLQQFNVRGDDRDQVPFVPAFQLGGGQTAQGAEHPVPQQGQQFEGNKMVACLFPIAQYRPQHRHKGSRPEQPCQRQRPGKAQHLQDAKPAKHRQKGGAQVPGQPHGHGQGHIPCQGPYQPHKPGHYGKTASFHAGTSCLV